MLNFAMYKMCSINAKARKLLFHLPNCVVKVLNIHTLLFLIKYFIYSEFTICAPLKDYPVEIFHLIEIHKCKSVEEPRKSSLHQAAVQCSKSIYFLKLNVNLLLSVKEKQLAFFR